VTIRLGTRGSQLALAQSGTIAAAIEALGTRVEIVVIETAGDVDRTSAFAAIGAAGIFVRELQRALLAGDVDLAVHSYKDLPSEVPEGLCIAAVPRRADVRDRLLVRADALDRAASVLPVGAGARIGTSAARRSALVRELRPDVQTVPLRGNVNTRVDRLARGDYEAIVLAGAGLDRLAAAGFVLPAGIVAHDLDPRTFVPAPSQGALGLETRTDDAATRTVVARLQHEPTARTVAVERALLERLAAGCDVAFGAWCEEDAGQRLVLHGLLERDGVVIRARAVGRTTQEVVAPVFAALTGPAEGAVR
jgi:hydroxymethylbilane synthase